MKALLLETQPYSETLGSRVNRNFASGILDEGQFQGQPGGTHPYPVRLNSDFTHQVSTYSGNLPGNSQSSIGSISINNVDGRFDDLLELDWGGAPAVIRSSETNTLLLSGYVTEFTGSIVEVTGDQNNITFILRDNSYLLIQPLQSSKYGGGGSSDGTSTLRGLQKPLCFGLCENLTPVQVDPVKLCYQLHDGTVEQVLAVYDDAVPLTYVGNVGSYASLESATIPRGCFASCNSVGFIKLGAPPAGTLTVDCQGQFYSSVDLPETLREIISQRSVNSVSVNEASFTALSAIAPYRVSGLYFQNPEDQLDRFIEEALGKIDAFFFFNSAGQLQVRKFGFSTPSSVVFGEDVTGLQRTLSTKPVFKVSALYRRNSTVQDPESLPIGVGEFNGRLDKESYTEGGGVSAVGVFRVFLGSQPVNELSLVTFQKLTTAPWITLYPDGSYLITMPTVGQYSVRLAAQLNQFTVVRELTLFVNVPRTGLELAVTNQDIVQNTDGTFVNPAQSSVLTLTRYNEVGAVSWSATDNLGRPVALTGSGDSRTLTVSSISTSPLLTDVVVTAVASSSGQTARSTIAILKKNDIVPAQGGATRNRFMGEWVAGSNYILYDVVTYEGSSFIALSPHLSTEGNFPPNANFSSFAAQGADGDRGADGASTYSWIAYADSSDGVLNFTTGAPGGRGFIGRADNKTNPVESIVASDYSWSQYSGPPAFGLVNNGGVSIVGNRVIAYGPVYPTFSGSAFSSESYVGACSVSFKPDNADVAFMVGLNTDPVTNNDWTSIDFALHCYESGVVGVYGRDAPTPFYTSPSGFYSGSSIFQIFYDGFSRVFCSHNGAVFYTFENVPSGLRLFVDTSFRGNTNPVFSNGVTITSFVPGGSVAKWIRVRSDNYNSSLNGFSGQDVSTERGLLYNGFRGHNLTVFNPDGSVYSVRDNHDTYASGTASLVSALNAVPTGKIVTLFTTDASSMTAPLRAVLDRMGGSVDQNFLWSDRVSHAFIGMPGLKRGQGYESVSSGTGVDGLVFQQAMLGANGIVLNGLEGKPNFSLVGRNVFITGSTVTKTGGGSWGTADAYTLESYKNGAALTFRPLQSESQVMVGLNADPLLDQHWGSLDFAIYLYSAGGLQIYESGVPGPNFGVTQYSSSTVFTIQYDGKGTVYYLKDGVQFHSSAVAAGLSLYADSAMAENGAGFELLSFGPGSASGNNGTNGTNGSTGASSFSLMDVTCALFPTPSSFKKAACGNSWQYGKARTRESSNTGATISFEAQADTGGGLTDDVNNSDPSFANIDYWFHASGNGNLYVYRNGAWTGFIQYGYTPGTIMSVTSDNSRVYYRYGGTVVYDHEVSPVGQNLHGVLTIFNQDAVMNNITFSVAGSKGGQGPQGPQGSTGISAPPLVVLNSVGSGQTSGIRLQPGQTVTAEAYVWLSVGSATGASIQVQIREANVGTWEVMTDGTDSSGLPASEAIELTVSAATYTNPTGIPKQYDIRSVVTSSGRTADQTQSYLRVI